MIGMTVTTFIRCWTQDSGSLFYINLTPSFSVASFELIVEKSVSTNTGITGITGITFGPLGVRVRVRVRVRVSLPELPSYH